VLVRSLTIGTRDWGGLSLAVRQMFPPAGETIDFDGMPAANLLRGLEVGIDMPARRAMLFNPQGCRPGTPPWPAATSLPMEMMEHGTPRISVRVEGQVVSARIASGQQQSSMARTLAEKPGWPAPIPSSVPMAPTPTPSVAGSTACGNWRRARKCGGTRRSPAMTASLKAGRS
jgi:hypothetical protein